MNNPYDLEQAKELIKTRIDQGKEGKWTEEQVIELIATDLAILADATYYAKNGHFVKPKSS